MKKNVGSTDAFIRFLVGLALLINIIILQAGPLATVVLIALGLMMFYSAYSKFCPAYIPLNICTCDDKNCLCQSNEATEEASE